jgi:prepilin-type N-terminal cleavage/methylation domain-containing protein
MPYSIKRGFTLIELLVVVAIIGMLSSIILYSVTETRNKAQNSARVQKVIQWRNALELYRADHNGYYYGSQFVPYCIGQSSGTCRSDNSVGSGQVSSTFYQTEMGSYISSSDGTDTTIPVGGAGEIDQGIVYFCLSIENEGQFDPYGCKSYVMWFSLKNASTCPVGIAIDTFQGNVTCRMPSTGF